MGFLLASEAELVATVAGGLAMRIVGLNGIAAVGHTGTQLDSVR